MPEKKRKFSFKLGADPEFSLTFQNKRVEARTVIEDLMGRKGNLRLSEEGVDFPGGNFGWDGCDSTGEIRPNPSNDPAEITKNIKSMLTEAYPHLKIFGMSTLSVHAPVGGHLHFQIPESLRDNEKAQNILHKKMATFYLPILISENKMNLKMRCTDNDCHPGYGDLTDYRVDYDGHYDNATDKNEFTYEFRVPSAEWMTTEKICQATFAYLGVVYHEIMNQPDNFKKYIKLVYENDSQCKALYKLAISEYVGITAGLFNEIKKTVRKFELYPDYKEEIEYILNPQKVIKDKVKAGYEIFAGWDIKEKKREKKVPLRDLCNKKKFEEIIQKENMDYLKKTIEIQYNDDLNISGLVKELTTRIAAFNWKLKNNYFIFGLKKGIDSIIAFDSNKKTLYGEKLIQTILDADCLESLKNRMIKKFYLESKKINPITMKIETEKMVIIGLPYEMRMKNNAKELITLIHRIEGGRIKSLKINQKTLINDIAIPEKERGKFYKYYTGIKDESTPVTESPFPTIPFDTNSQGFRIAEENAKLIINGQI
jgi:Phage phiEco32-like COOH.NH2 ligase-type 2